MILQPKWKIERRSHNVCDIKMSYNDYICSDFLIITLSLVWGRGELPGGLGDSGQERKLFVCLVKMQWASDADQC